MDLGTDEVTWSGQIMQDMKESGSSITLTVWESFSTLMEMSMMANGETIQQMVSGSISMLRELAIKEDGKRTSSMAME